MAFPDFPFANQQKSFLHHSEVGRLVDEGWNILLHIVETQVLEYLEQYAQAHLLHKYIQFNTLVHNASIKM